MDFMQLWTLIQLAEKLAGSPATANLFAAVMAEIQALEAGAAAAKAAPAPSRLAEALGQFGGAVAPSSVTQTSGSAK